LTSLTFYGGIGEIGGNKILVETESGNVLLDFGRRMGITGSYYSEFLQTRSKNALRDLLRLDVLPKISGVYDKQYLDTTSLLENPADKVKIPLTAAKDYWVAEGIAPYNPDAPRVDGVFISHAHFDHIQDLSFLDPTIPIYCSKETEILSKSICDLSSSSVDQQFYELRRPAKIISKSTSYKTLFSGELDYKDEVESEKPEILDLKTGFTFCREYTCEYRNYNTKLEGKIRGIDYRLIPVGHSIPGACSVLLTTPNKTRILYTGDLRFHGSTGVTKEQYAETVDGQVDYLIIEGTRVDSQKILTEHDVQREIESDIKSSKGLVLIDFGWKDLSRFNVIYEAVRNNNRIFVVSPKVAYLLYEMHINFPGEYQDPRTMSNLKVYLKREGSLLYSKADYEKFKMGYLDHHGRNTSKTDKNIIRIAEKLGKGGDVGNSKNPLPDQVPGQTYEYQEVYDLATHHLEHGIKAYEIRSNPSNYVLMFSYWDSNELFDLIPETTEHKTKYIRASTEPFNDEMRIDEKKFVNWLEHFNIQFNHELTDKGEKTFQARHVSGHLSQPELIELVKLLKPRKIIPVHTTHQEIFRELFGDKVILVEPEKPLILE
jgi:ribonuclease J